MAKVSKWSEKQKPVDETMRNEDIGDFGDYGD